MSVSKWKIPEVRWRTASIDSVHQIPLFLLSAGYSAYHLLFHGKRRAAEICGSGFDCVTVVFEADLPLIRLQARSLARYLDPAFAGDIILVVNDLDVGGVTQTLRREILPDYGPWAERVRIVPFYELGYRLDPWNGWTMQQAFKLAISERVAKPFYLVLDSKNHLIRPAAAERFVTPEGRAIQPLDFRVDVLPAHWDVALRYFGIDPSAVRPCAPATPFVMHTRTVRDLVAFLEAKEGRSIFSIFAETRLLSEFLLYRAFLYRLAAAGAPAPYVEGAALSLTLWPGDGNIETSIARVATDPALIFLGVHREALKRLNSDDLSRLRRLWRRAGLLAPGEKIAGLLPSPEGEREAAFSD